MHGFMRRGWLGFVLGLIAAGTSWPALAQSCLWGDTSPMEPPIVTPLAPHARALRAPGRLAVDAAGNLYVADPAAGSVEVLDPGGALLRSKTGLAEPSAVAVGGDGSIYVAEAAPGSVAVYDADWNFVQYLGRGAGEILLPNDMVVDPDPGVGRVYVSDAGRHEIRVYTTSGAFAFAFGGRGSAAGEFDFPAALFIAPAGGPAGAAEVLVADQNNDRIQIFDRSGNFQRCFGGGPGSSRKFGRILGLTGDEQGRVYVADAFQGHVQVFDSQLGVLLETVGSFGSGERQLRTPMGLVVDRFGRLLVASVNNGRIERFGLDDFIDPPGGGLVFRDDFETGDASRWSRFVY